MSAVVAVFLQMISRLGYCYMLLEILIIYFFTCIALSPVWECILTLLSFHSN